MVGLFVCFLNPRGFILLVFSGRSLVFIAKITTWFGSTSVLLTEKWDYRYYEICPLNDWETAERRTDS